MRTRFTSWVLGRWRRRVALAVVLAVAGAVGIGVAAVPALAADARRTIGNGIASCPEGYVCLWTLTNYTGQGYAFFNSETDYGTLPAPFNGIQDYSWSFYNNGKFSDILFFRDHLYQGDWFVLCKQTGIPYLPPNGELPTAGNEPGRGWRDQISSHHFGAWC
jgi:hypothetical protein